MASAVLIPHRYTFRVRNSAGTQLEDVVVSLNGSRASTGQLQPGETATVYVWSKRGSGLTVEIPRGTGKHFIAFQDFEVGRSGTTLVVGPDFNVSLKPGPAV
jgi:hypothetical protein